MTIRRLVFVVVPLLLIILVGFWLQWAPVVAAGGVMFNARWTAERSIAMEKTIAQAKATASSDDREVLVNDPNSTGNYRVTATCTRHGNATSARVMVRGRETGLQSGRVSATYLVKAVPALTNYGDQEAFRTWSRAVRPGSRWHLGAGPYRAGFALFMCPSLLASRLNGVLPTEKQSANFTVIHGRPAVHLHFEAGMESQGGGVSDDLYVDVLTLHWLRADLYAWGPGCCRVFQMRIHYSQS